MPPDPPSSGPSRHVIALLACSSKLKSVPLPMTLEFHSRLYIQSNYISTVKYSCTLCNSMLIPIQQKGHWRKGLKGEDSKLLHYLMFKMVSPEFQAMV